MLKIALFFVLTFYSCSEIKETLIDSETGEKIIGFTPDCKYQIGKTKKTDYTDVILLRLMKDSLYLSFTDAAFSNNSKTLVAGGGNGKYVTSKGLKPGDSVEKALSIYGKPVATDVEYWWDKKQGLTMSYQGLFYKNIAVLIDTARNNTVRGISIGRQYPIEKKYQRESSWFRD